MRIGRWGWKKIMRRRQTGNEMEGIRSEVEKERQVRYCSQEKGNDHKKERETDGKERQQRKIVNYGTRAHRSEFFSAIIVHIIW